MNTKLQTSKNRGAVMSVVSGTVVAICLTLVFILLFALLIRFFNIPDGVIFPVNQVIKVVSMFIGAVIFLKKQNNRGFLKGLVLGLCYYILSFIVFSILQGSFSVTLSNVIDLLLTTLMGGIIGIIVVNVIRK